MRRRLMRFVRRLEPLGGHGADVEAAAETREHRL